MNNIRIIVILLAFIALYGCDRITSTKHTVNEILVNKTTDKYIYIVETDVKIDTIISHGLDSNVVIFVRNSTINLPFFGANTIYIDWVKVNKRYLYNISDTTSYIRPSNNAKNDSIFFTHIEFKRVLVGGSTYNQLDTTKLTVNNEIKKIFLKDYSMLSKFKDYYKK